MTFDPNVPSSLLDLQKWFGSLVVCPLRSLGEFRLPLYDERAMREIGERMSAGPKLSAAQRIGIYNQQYWWRLFVLLQEKYPGLLRLFGHTEFNRVLAEPYFMKYPPDHWSLSLLGSRFPQWVEEAYTGEDKGLVLQMAQIEEGYERLWYSPLFPWLKMGEIEGVVFLQPSIALFALDADLFSFRDALIVQEPQYWEENEFPPIHWSDSRRYFILHREEETLFHEEISHSQYLLLQAFAKGAAVPEACSRLGNDAAGNVAVWLEKWTSLGWLTTVSPQRGGFSLGLGD